MRTARSRGSSSCRTPREVGFIAAQGRREGPGPDRFFNPSQNPEIWLKQGDIDGLHVTRRRAGIRGDPLPAPGRRLHRLGPAPVGRRDRPERGQPTWEAPKPPTAIDDYGAYWKVLIQDAAQPVNFIVHKGDEKDTAEDRSFLPTEIRGGLAPVGRLHDPQDARLRRGLRGHPLPPRRTATTVTRPRPTSTTSGASTRGPGTCDPDPKWTTPIKPAGTDRLRSVLQARPRRWRDRSSPTSSTAATRRIPVQTSSLDLVNVGHEVWYLSGHTDADQMAEVPAADPGRVGHGCQPDAPEGALADREHARLGHRAAARRRVRAPLRPRRWPRRRRRESPAARRSRWPASRAASRPSSRRSGRTSPTTRRSASPPAISTRSPEALKGQLAVSATDADGNLRIATGVQIPGVLDDLYANDGALGVAWAGSVPTVRVWAPTAKSVALRLYPDATTASSTTHAMTRDDATGVWSVTGTAAWKDQYYLYDVEVFAPSTGQVEHNLVTDPYSLALARNSTRSPDRQPVRRGAPARGLVDVHQARPAAPRRTSRSTSSTSATSPSTTRPSRPRSAGRTPRSRGRPRTGCVTCVPSRTRA